jgi:hypothetical protein
LAIPLDREEANRYANFWRYQIGVNVIPSNTENKTTYVKWSEWQDKPIPEELHNSWKEQGAFSQGNNSSKSLAQ